MRQHLIGYLLDAVDTDERQNIAQQLERDESLRRELDLLKTSLHPLSADQGHHEPPPGLARRCCDFVYSRTEIVPAALSPESASAATGKRHRWSWLDLSVAGAIAVAVLVLLVPAIYQSRLHSQLVACQSNLKDIGSALAHYTNRHHSGYPQPMPDDRFNAVGTWATRLVNEGDLEPQGRTVFCPSGKLPDNKNFHEPRWEELEAMSPTQLAEIYPWLAGYTFNLGYHDPATGAYKTRRNLQRHNFPVSSDPPDMDLISSANHGRGGFNALFEDGSFRFLTSNLIGGDDMYRNRDLEIGPGKDEDDAVLVSAGVRAR
jgi:hypothetical protein